MDTSHSQGTTNFASRSLIRIPEAFPVPWALTGIQIGLSLGTVELFYGSRQGRTDTLWPWRWLCIVDQNWLCHCRPMCKWTIAHSQRRQTITIHSPQERKNLHGSKLLMSIERYRYHYHHRHQQLPALISRTNLTDCCLSQRVALYCTAWEAFVS